MTHYYTVEECTRLILNHCIYPKTESEQKIDSVRLGGLDIAKASKLKEEMKLLWRYWKENKGYYKLLFIDNISKLNNEELIGADAYVIINLTKCAKNNLKLLNIPCEGSYGLMVICFGGKFDGRKITDAVIDTFLNYNTVHLLLNGKTRKYTSYRKKLNHFKENVHNNDMNLNDFVIVSSGILGIYGMRCPTDIDMITTEMDFEKVCDRIIDSHHHVLETYEITAERLVSDPENYAYWEGFKFAALEIVAKACNNRVEKSKKLDGEFIGILQGEIRCSSFKLVEMRIIHWYIRTTREYIKKPLMKRYYWVIVKIRELFQWEKKSLR